MHWNINMHPSRIKVKFTLPQFSQLWQTVTLKSYFCKSNIGTTFHNIFNIYLNIDNEQILLLKWTDRFFQASCKSRRKCIMWENSKYFMFSYKSHGNYTSMPFLGTTFQVKNNTFPYYDSYSSHSPYITFPSMQVLEFQDLPL